jgi:acetyl esterase/lipase
LNIVEVPLCESAPVAGLSETIVERSENPDVRQDRAVTNVFSSSLFFTRPPVEGPVPVVLLCPGGGYSALMIDKEGYDIARWLGRLGIAAAILKYRLPHPEAEAALPWPSEDACKAMEVLSARAGEWGLRADAVGIFGASAGGHLAACIANRPDCRPAFQILLYPVISFLDYEWSHTGSRRNLLSGKTDHERCLAFSAEKWVTPSTPPAYVIHAIDDGVVKVEHSRRYCAALRESGVPCEYLELNSGGHGFGMAVHGGDPLVWPEKCAGWLGSLLEAPTQPAIGA